VWIDTKDVYWTLDNDYIESVWWLFRQMWDAGLVYEGHRVSPYCPRCGTALSSHEMGQPDVYRDVVDQTVYVRLPLRDDDADLLVWTTTPWTLISNVAAAVDPDLTYVRVPAPGGGRDLVLAEPASARLFPGAEPTGRFPGRQLIGRRYERPFSFLPFPMGAPDRSEIVVTSAFVNPEEGTGIVHMAAGASDFRC
jgi:isoleucyl-tRNA synthetase